MITTEGVSGDGGAPLRRRYWGPPTILQAAASKSECAHEIEVDTETGNGDTTLTTIIAPPRSLIQVTPAWQQQMMMAAAISHGSRKRPCGRASRPW
jgi:hypothetical protein